MTDQYNKLLRDATDRLLTDATPEERARVDRERREVHAARAATRAVVDQNRALLADQAGILEVIRDHGTDYAGMLTSPECVEKLVRCMAATLYAEFHQAATDEALAELDEAIRAQRQG
jgi:hypothetical protein